jgi:hypothetical protein
MIFGPYPRRDLARNDARVSQSLSVAVLQGPQVRDNAWLALSVEPFKTDF